MNLEALLSDDAARREPARQALASAPEHERSAFASKIVTVARAAAAAIDAGSREVADETRLVRACDALALVRVEIAKNALLRIADEGTPNVKAALARALHETKTTVGRAVLVHLLSDDDARADAIRTIGMAPWPEVLPALIEIAEADDQAAPLAATPIARCGATAGPNEANAAADFLLELLDDDATMPAAVEALLRFGAGLPGIAQTARRLAKTANKRRVGALCLVAAFGDEGAAGFVELALCAKTDLEAAKTFLAPLLADADDRIRGAAEQTARALGVGASTRRAPPSP